MSLNVHYSHCKELKKFIFFSFLFFFYSLFELLTNLFFFSILLSLAIAGGGSYTAVLISELLNKGLIISNNFCNQLSRSKLLCYVQYL